MLALRRPGVRLRQRRVHCVCRGCMFKLLLCVNYQKHVRQNSASVWVHLRKPCDVVSLGGPGLGKISYIISRVVLLHSLICSLVRAPGPGRDLLSLRKRVCRMGVEVLLTHALRGGFPMLRLSACHAHRDSSPRPFCQSELRK